MRHRSSLAAMKVMHTIWLQYIIISDVCLANDHLSFGRTHSFISRLRINVIMAKLINYMISTLCNSSLISKVSDHIKSILSSILLSNSNNFLQIVCIEHWLIESKFPQFLSLSIHEFLSCINKFIILIFHFISLFILLCNEWSLWIMQLIPCQFRIGDALIESKIMEWNCSLFFILAISKFDDLSCWFNLHHSIKSLLSMIKWRNI